MAISEVGRCSYLFHENRPERDHRVDLHSHPFWQLEVTLKGPIVALIAGERVPIPVGTGLLIAPGCPHGFTSDGQACRFLSLKFLTIETDTPAWSHHLVDEEPGTALIAALISLIPSRVQLGAAQRAAVGDVLSALLNIEVRPLLEDSEDRPHRQRQQLIEGIKDFIETRVEVGLSVQAIAEHFGYTSRHLSALYREQEGEALKRAIDDARATHAGRMLDYSGQSITEIAEAMNFSDVYAFSRFFRRVRGLSPSHWRQRPEARPRFDYSGIGA